MPNSFFRRAVLLAVLLAFTAALSGCSVWKDWLASKKRVGGSVENMYAQGAALYKDGRYKRAAEVFVRVKEQYPLHPLALLAEIGAGDAYFSDENYGEAELAYADFVNLHPTNENVPYVMYQIGMCHYKQMLSFDQDTSRTVRAIKEFEKLMAKYPASKFSFMAEKRIQEGRQRLAHQEFYIGEFYFKRGNYKAALKRFEYLSKTYPNLGFDYQTAAYLKESQKRVFQEEVQKMKDDAKKAKREAEEKRKAAEKEKKKNGR